MKKLTLFAVAFVLVLGAACSSSSNTTTPSSSPTESESEGGIDEVAMTDSLKFVPSAMTIKAGDTVEWMNDGTAPHTVTSDDAGGPLKSDNIDQGEKYSHKFDAAGTFKYHCSIHPQMMGTITIA